MFPPLTIPKLSSIQLWPIIQLFYINILICKTQTIIIPIIMKTKCIKNTKACIVKFSSVLQLLIQFLKLKAIVAQIGNNCT